MPKGKKIAMGAGIVVIVGVGAVIATRPHPAAHQESLAKKAAIRQQRKVPRKPAAPTTRSAPASVTPPSTPPIPSTGQNSAASAQASLAALTHQEGVATPPGPIDIVPNLANPNQVWAFATEAAPGQSTGYTLWFGERTGNGPWTWIPSTLPGALSTKLPPAVYSTLQWAYDLHEGQPGPTLYGTVSWNAVTGHVGEPEGWVAGVSPLPGGHPMLTLTGWVPSYTGSYSGYYGVQSQWLKSTIAAGQSGLSMIVPGGQQTLNQLAHNPNP